MTYAVPDPAPRCFELLGISHRTAPLSVLEGLAMAPEEVDAFYAHLRADGQMSQALLLSTCNRTEFYGLKTCEGPLGDHLLTILREIVGAERLPPDKHLYRAHGREGIEHLFRVTSGLDSMVLGEAQILGQVRDAYDKSCTHFKPDPWFHRMVHAAIVAGKRSRSETEIGEGAVSVASAAVHLATRVFSELTKRTVVVIGAGDTSRLLAEHLAAATPKRLIIVNRTLARAEELAKRLGGAAYPWDKLVEAVAEADVVATAVRAAAPILDVPLLHRALVHRGGRPLAILDLALPRNVSPEVDALPNVFVNDIEALRHVVDSNLGRRKKEVPHVEAIIDEEIEHLFVWQRTREAGPLIATLRDSAEAIRQAELARLAGSLSEVERAAVDRATRAVVNKILHAPMATIRDLCCQDDVGERLEGLRDTVGRLKTLSEQQPGTSHGAKAEARRKLAHSVGEARDAGGAPEATALDRARADGPASDPVPLSVAGVRCREPR